MGVDNFDMTETFFDAGGCALTLFDFLNDL